MLGIFQDLLEDDHSSEEIPRGERPPEDDVFESVLEDELPELE